MQIRSFITDDDKPDTQHEIIDFLALLTGRRPRRRKSLLEPETPPEDDRLEPEPFRPSHRHQNPAPLTAGERPYFAEVPLDARGAPHYRSQLAVFEAERASVTAGRMRMFSFDDDTNALHFIARFERAGVGHLAEPYHRQLAEHRAREAALGKPLHRLDYADRDYGSEALMQRMYGAPEEDRARIIQYFRRGAEMDAATSLGVPSRYSRLEPM